MLLKTFNFTGNGTGTSVVNDDATNQEIATAMMLDALEKDSNDGKPSKKLKEEKDG